MNGHTLYRATQAIRALWDANLICQCAHTWRSHWTARTGTPCDVTGCLCQVWSTRQAAPADGEEG